MNFPNPYLASSVCVELWLPSVGSLRSAASASIVWRRALARCAPLRLRRALALAVFSVKGTNSPSARNFILQGTAVSLDCQWPSMHKLTGVLAGVVRQLPKRRNGGRRAKRQHRALALAAARTATTSKAAPATRGAPGHGRSDAIEAAALAAALAESALESESEDKAGPWANTRILAHKPNVS